MSRDVKVAEQLLQRGTKFGVHVAERDKFGCHPLHLAASKGDIDMVKLLLQHKAPIDAQNRDGLTPLHYACKAKKENVRMVELLLANGADENLATRRGLLPSHIAARKGYAKIVALLSQYQL